MDLILGQPYRITITVTDMTPGSPTYNTPQDPGTLTLRMRGPRDTGPTLYTAAGGQLVRDSPGIYHLDWTPTEPGGWARRWVTTTPFAGATPEIYATVLDSTVG